MKKFLMVLGGIFFAIVVIAVIIFAAVSLTSKKLKCESELGTITIMYNDKRLTGYTAKGFSYEFDAQKKSLKKLALINT